jgi:hypothetical protein
MASFDEFGGFDANNVAPTSFDVLPAGEYEAAIVASEMKATQAGDGKYLSLRVQILNGEYQNRLLFDNLNLLNPNAKAQEIARGTLSALCHAVGVLTPKDSGELHDKPMRIKVKVTKSEEYGEQNKITAYKPRNNGPVLPGFGPGTLPTEPVTPETPPAAKAPW